MSVAKYLIVFLLFLKGISARSIVKHVTLGETHLIRLTDENYAIALQDNNYVWKVVTVNGNDVITVDGYCVVDSHNLDEDSDSELYQNILTKLNSLKDESQLAELGYEGKEFSVEVFDNDGEVSVESGAIGQQGPIRVHTFSIPFSQLKAKVLLHSKFVATIDPLDRIQMRPDACVSEQDRANLESLMSQSRNLQMQTRDIFERQSSSSSSYLYDDENMPQMTFPGEEIEQENPSGSRNPPGSSNERPKAAYPPLDELLRELSPDEPLRDPVDTWVLLRNIYRKANAGQATEVPPEYLKIVEGMIRDLDVSVPECTPEGLAKMSIRMRTLDNFGQRTDARHITSEFTKNQYDNCFHILELNTIKHSESFSNDYLQYLIDFYKQVRDQYYEDYQVSPQENLLEGVIPTKSLYTTLATHIKCKDPNLAKLVKKSSKESTPILLADAVEQHIGKMCHPFERALSQELELYDLLMNYQAIKGNLEYLSENAHGILTTARICKAINQENLDTDRLVSAFHGEPSKKSLNCIN